MGVNGHDDRTQCNEGGIFMNDFIFSYPTKVYFGKDALKKAAAEQLDAFGSNVLLAYG